MYFGDPPESHAIRAARLDQGHVFLKLEGVTDREAAQALRGTELLIPQAEAVTLPEGEFFWHEVIGLRVDDAAGDTLGTVTDIIETGANHVYVVRGDRGEILVPAIKDVVKLIDPPGGKMVIEPLPGMLPDPPHPRTAWSARPRTRGRKPPQPRPHPPSEPAP